MNRKPNAKKATAVTLLLALSMTLTGCFQEVPSDENRVAAPKASVSASPAPSESASIDPELAEKLKENEITKGDDTEAAAEANKEYFDAVQKAQRETPLGVNVAETVAEKTTPAAQAAFADFDIEEGARFSLEFWQRLIQKGDFYGPRDASRDFDLLTDVAPMMTGSLQDEIKAEIADVGKFVRILTANSAGTIGTDRDGNDLAPVTIPTHKFWVKEVTVEGEFLVVYGYSEMTVLTKAGTEFVYGYDFGVRSVPGADGSWQVAETWQKGQQVN